MHPSKEFMSKAIELARNSHEGDCDVGCVIVKDGKIIAEGVTAVNKEKDPTAHAEMVAIKAAAKKLGSKKLEGCYLYSTYEPCPMCAAAAVWARVKGIVYGAAMADETERSPQRIKLSCAEVLRHGTPKVELYPDFMREECRKLLL